MRAAAVVVAFAATAFALDDTSMFDQATSPEHNQAAAAADSAESESISIGALNRTPSLTFQLQAPSLPQLAPPLRLPPLLRPTSALPSLLVQLMPPMPPPLLRLPSPAPSTPPPLTPLPRSTLPQLLPRPLSTPPRLAPPA